MISSSFAAMRALAAAIIVGAAAIAAPAAAQQVTVEHESDLRAEPRLEAAITAKVPVGATGEVTGKRGPWLQISTPGASGWLFSFNVRFGAGAKAAGDSGAGSALGRLVGPKRNVNVTATIGIRGLDEEDLRQAKFDPAQVKLLEQYVATAEAAAERARAAGLAAAKLDYFDAKPQ